MGSIEQKIRRGVALGLVLLDVGCQVRESTTPMAVALSTGTATPAAASVPTFAHLETPINTPAVSPSHFPTRTPYNSPEPTEPGVRFTRVPFPTGTPSPIPTGTPTSIPEYECIWEVGSSTVVNQSGDSNSITKVFGSGKDTIFFTGVNGATAEDLNNKFRNGTIKPPNCDVGVAAIYDGNSIPKRLSVDSILNSVRQLIRNVIEVSNKTHKENGQKKKHDVIVVYFYPYTTPNFDGVMKENLTEFESRFPEEVAPEFPRMSVVNTDGVIDGICPVRIDCFEKKVDPSTKAVIPDIHANSTVRMKMMEVIRTVADSPVQPVYPPATPVFPPRPTFSPN